MAWVEDELYKVILEKLPVVTVDAVIVHNDKFLLLKRNNPPVKDEWWIAGGRVFKNETLEAAVKRKVLEETGLNCKILCQAGVLNQLFSEENVHTVTIYFLMESDSMNVKLNDDHSEYKWVAKLDPDAHPFLRTIVENSIKKLAKLKPNR
ncbi:MAG: NUDIX domain-containing protein [Nitrososphaeria archaeon]|nr:NUDIX domain-containing protein [Nitrososphaeria archaeon]NIN53322.1 NUDIX domain-containing protein [Nitrososphaeria archaeon]NIQ33775.1 NUDIX domain-containing protein [Nitrososphaeria archaeon]